MAEDGTVSEQVSPRVSPRQSFADWSTFVPTWWQVFAWLAMTVGTVWSVSHGTWGIDHTGTRALAAFVFTASAVAILALPRQVTGFRATLVVIAVVGGLATVFLAPAGLGEVPVFMGAAQIPSAFPQRRARVFTAVATVATGATIGYVSHSIAGVLAGIGVPLVAQRALARQALVEQRDIAEALLAEVQAGRDAEAQAAALRERGRIAREMHDVLAHSLAGLSLQLQAVRAVAQKEGVGLAVLEPLDRAADLARDGLAEAKSAVGTLNDPTLRTIAEIPELISLHPGEAVLTVGGEPRLLTREAEHAAYRAVQESLTNAARYAPGSSVQVTLTWTDDSLGIDIADDGTATGHTPLVGQGTGLGIAGMRERLAAVDGTVHAGLHGNGWQVSLTLPAAALIPTSIAVQS